MIKLTPKHFNSERDESKFIPGELLHLPHGGDGVPGFPLPYQPGHPVHPEVVEHAPVRPGHHLVGAGRPQLAGVLPVVVDTARVNQHLGGSS